MEFKKTIRIDKEDGEENAEVTFVENGNEETKEFDDIKEAMDFYNSIEEEFEKEDKEKEDEENEEGEERDEDGEESSDKYPKLSIKHLKSMPPLGMGMGMGMGRGRGRGRGRGLGRQDGKGPMSEMFGGQCPFLLQLADSLDKEDFEKEANLIDKFFQKRDVNLLIKASDALDRIGKEKLSEKLDGVICKVAESLVDIDSKMQQVSNRIKVLKERYYNEGQGENPDTKKMLELGRIIEELAGSYDELEKRKQLASASGGTIEPNPQKNMIVTKNNYKMPTISMENSNLIRLQLKSLNPQYTNFSETGPFSWGAFWLFRKTFDGKVGFPQNWQLAFNRDFYDKAPISAERVINMALRSSEPKLKELGPKIPISDSEKMAQVKNEMGIIAKRWKESKDPQRRDDLENQFNELQRIYNGLLVKAEEGKEVAVTKEPSSTNLTDYEKRNKELIERGREMLGRT